MLDYELGAFLKKIQEQKCEEKKVEVKSAHRGCPERLYDTISAFANQDEGGTLVFGLDETDGFAKVGVYDAQDLQKKLMEHCEQMTPVIRPVLTVYHENGHSFVSAEIPPLDVAERPCFKTAKGRLRGAYIRVGDADKPMTEYEVYSYEAFRKKYRDDVRPVEDVSIEMLSLEKLDEYLVLRKRNRSNLASVSEQQLYELTGIVRHGQVTLSAVFLFSPYPQAYFPQLGINAVCVPGTQMGMLSEQGQRFIDNKRIEGTIPEMLESALAFVRGNMRMASKINTQTGKREDIPQYPMDAIREVILNALIHRDYSIHTQGMPICLTIYSDRLEIKNPGGLYGRICIDQLGQSQADTRNPVLVTALKVLGYTENRYSGIPRIRLSMEEMGLPAPVFEDNRGEFVVTLYSEAPKPEQPVFADDKKGLLAFCTTPRSRREIADFLGIASVQYALSRYVAPFIKSNRMAMTNPASPKDPKQKYYTVTDK